MSTHNICLYKEVKKKYTDCNLKTTEFLDCALIGVCALIRCNMVHHCFLVVKRTLSRVMIGHQSLENDDDIWCFTSLSTLYMSYWDYGRVIMKGYAQQSTVKLQAIRLKQNSKSGPRDPKSGSLSNLPPRCFPITWNNTLFFPKNFLKCFLQIFKVGTLGLKNNGISSFLYQKEEKVVSPPVNNSLVKHFPDVIKIFNIFPHSTTCILAPDNVLFFSTEKLLIFFLLLYENICFGTHQKHLTEAILMSTHNIYFHEEIKKQNKYYLETPLILI